MGPFNYYVCTEGGGGVSEKVSRGKQGEEGLVRLESLYFKRFQRHIIAAIA